MKYIAHIQICYKTVNFVLYTLGITTFIVTKRVYPALQSTHIKDL